MTGLRNGAVALALCGVLLGGALPAGALAAGALAGAGAAYAQGSSVAADPSSQQIYAAARAGNLALAQQMIDQVLRDHPRSARAHYVAAQVYARSGDLPRARQELGLAQGLSPGLPFAQPDSVAQLQQALGGRSGVFPGQPHRSVSWPGIIFILAGVGLLIALLRRRWMAAQAAQGYGQYPAAAPYGQPMGQPMGMGVPQGSGLIRNLATGLAVGAGVAAGEELVQHMLGGGSSLVPAAGADELADGSDANMGGADFGLDADNGSWDDGGGGVDGGADFGGGGGDWS